jgi:hypothetical protein
MWTLAHCCLSARFEVIGLTLKRRGAHAVIITTNCAADILSFFTAAFGPSLFGSQPAARLLANRFAAAIAMAPAEWRGRWSRRG